MDSALVDFFVCCDRCGLISRMSESTVHDDPQAVDGVYVVCPRCKPTPYVRSLRVPWYRSDTFHQALQGIALGLLLAGGICTISWWMGHH